MNPADRTRRDNDMEALLKMARALAATVDLNALLGMVVGYSMELLGAERATLFLYDQESQQLYSRIAEGVDEFRISIDTGLAGAAARSRKIVNTPDAYKDERFNPDVDKRTGWRTRNILSCPLIDYEGRLVGVLQVLNKHDGSFDKHDIALAEALSAQAGVALQRAHLIEQQLEKQRLEQALEVARQVQQKLFPSKAPELASFDIAVWNRPCDATGGDCCDFLRLDDARLVLMLGDVSGHGVGPALVSCATRAMLRAMSSVNDDIAAVMCRVNDLLTADLADNRFVTVFLGMLDKNRGELTYYSAGQAPLLWLHGANNEVDTLGADGIPLGIMTQAPYKTAQTVALGNGDVFCLLTDGFYEWADSNKEMFGSQRVITILKDRQGDTADEILAAIVTAVEEFADTDQSDDLTAIIIKQVDAGVKVED